MADIGIALVSHLLSKSAITAVVGDRISPDATPQSETMPAIEYTVIDSNSEEHLGGIGGMAHTRVQIDCLADTRIAANDLQELVRLAPLQGFVGAMGSGEAETYVHGVSRAGSLRHETEKPVDGSDKWRYINSADYIISHEEATT